MTALTITLDDAQVRRLLDDLQRRLGDMRPAMAQIGESLAEGSKQRIEAGRDWRGQPFAPNKPSTLAKKKGARPLIDTGTLLHNRISYSADARSATVREGGGVRTRRIVLSGLARRTPLPAAKGLRPLWVNVPTNLRCPAHLQHLPGDFAASPSRQCSP